MKERPILFSGEMVRAILDGRKTQTRRIVGGTALRMLDEGFTPKYVADPGNSAWCPYGAIGDYLWVRETLGVTPNWGRVECIADGKVLYDPAIYQTDDRFKKLVEHYGDATFANELQKIPSIFMPRWASRITLEITKVRVERVQNISEQDAIHEGTDVCECIECCDGEHPGSCKECAGWADRTCDHCGGVGTCPVCNGRPETARFRFQKLWESINAKRGFGWDKNPFVWVIEFKPIGG